MVTARDAGVFSIVEFAFLVLVGNDGGVDGRGGVMKFGASLFFLFQMVGLLKRELVMNPNPVADQLTFQNYPSP